MPDHTPSTIQDTEALATGSSEARPDLGALRARLDDIDNAIHDLLMERAQVVEGVARSGKTAAFRPGREASILRRLVGRHSGQLPAQTLVRMWREMLAGTTAMQAPINVAVYDPSLSRAVTAMAREHFGVLTQTLEHPAVEAALGAVRSGDAAVAVLSFPLTEATWHSLLNGTPRLYVVARLPFWISRRDHVPYADAVAVASAAPDASGAASGGDHSFITAPPQGINGDMKLIADHGTILEVEGWIDANNPGLPPGSEFLGGYAIPMGGDTA